MLRLPKRVLRENVAVESVGEPVCEPVDEPMGSVEGPVCPGSTVSCVGLSVSGFPLVNESVVAIRDCVDVAVQTDGWLLKRLKVM